jgi:acetolactate synthase-1/2/3 large subunit
MFKPLTKWRWSIPNADSIPEITRRAFMIAAGEKEGAIHLELPQDIAKIESKIRPVGKQQVLRSRLNIDLIEKASKIIFEAKRPLFAIFADINNITKVMITIMATVRNMDF